MALLLFLALALVALLAAVGMVTSRNAVHSALFMLVNFAVYAIFYIMLNAQFLGVVQVIVYAGAIVVLFLFVVMLIGGEIGAVRSSLRRYTYAAALILGALFVAMIGLGIAQTISTDQTVAGAPAAGGVEAIGMALFTTYLLPFELASLLLLAGMVGGVARRYKALDED
ncbi:MAG: NADH-quinone oxidoreductase subunit J [Chloroflexi bacterium]|nr:NADH-quinone oxidoreductase subunit J [Chloroflexota bacterium]